MLTSAEIRGKTARFLSAPYVVWIAPTEHGGTVYMGAEALAVNVACRISAEVSIRVQPGGLVESGWALLLSTFIYQQWFTY